MIDGDIFVTDLASTNGVAIDGERIQASERTRFQTFLTLSFGSVESLQMSLDDHKSILIDSSLERYNRPKDTPDQGTPAPSSIRGKKEPSKSDDKTKGPGKFIRTKEKNKFKPLMTNILVIAGVIFAIYYFVSSKEEKTTAPIQKKKTNDDEYF
jgi:hypothetical protein